MNTKQNNNPNLDYLNGMDLVHLYLKLENMLLELVVAKRQPREFKLIDLGFSRVSKPKQKLDFIFGTPNYISPELLAKKSYLGHPADIQALEVILFLLLSQQFPLKVNTKQELLKNILAGNMSQPVYSLSQHALNVLRLIFQNNQLLRPSCQTILQHPWLSN